MYTRFGLRLMLWKYFYSQVERAWYAQLFLLQFKTDEDDETYHEDYYSHLVQRLIRPGGIQSSARLYTKTVAAQYRAVYGWSRKGLVDMRGLKREWERV